jgi:hypothetical protein
VAIHGARPLKVGDTLPLRAEPKDSRGRALADRSVEWGSSDPEVAPVDSAGVVIAAAAGSTEIKAASEGKTETVRVRVLPQPRTSRTEAIAAAQRASSDPAAATATPADAAVERKRVIDQMLAGVEQCYGALRGKDVVRVMELYRPATRSDREKLGKLERILRTREWDAQVGEREDGAQRLEATSPSMEFGFRLSWKDAFGGRLNSRPVFRAEFTRNGSSLDLTSCRIVGSPKL